MRVCDPIRSYALPVGGWGAARAWMEERFSCPATSNRLFGWYDDLLATR